MKKLKNQYPSGGVPAQNPVAKFAGQFNRAVTFCDKTQYRRKAKHPKQDAYAKFFLRDRFGISTLLSAYKQNLPYSNATNE